jgi:hypothetical protein
VHRLAPLMLGCAVVVAACDGTPSDELDRQAPWWLLIVFAVALVVVFVSLVTRGKKVPQVNPTSWKTDARTGYAAGRWLYDAMGEDLAVWRGNDVAVAEATPGAKQPTRSNAVPDAATSLRETWGALDQRYTEASDALYRLEVGAPDRRSSSMALEALSSLRTTRAALDRRADARQAYRAAAAGGAADAELVIAREQEVRASMHLAESRARLSEALGGLATVASDRGRYAS